MDKGTIIPNGLQSYEFETSDQNNGSWSYIWNNNRIKKSKYRSM